MSLDIEQRQKTVNSEAAIKEIKFALNYKQPVINHKNVLYHYR